MDKRAFFHKLYSLIFFILHFDKNLYYSLKQTLKIERNKSIIILTFIKME